jgi:hypothetical protein
MSYDDYDTDEDDTPKPPAKLKSKEGTEIMSPEVFRSEAISFVPEESDYASTDLSTIEKKLFTAEMDSYDLYLYNLHKAFKKTTTLSSLLSIVNMGLRVNQSRREAASILRRSRQDSIELDILGNPITSAKK